MSSATPRGAARPAPRTAREMLERSKAFLAERGAAEARLDAELLVSNALGLDRLGLFLQLDRPVTAEELERARALVGRRARGEPVAYLTGRREFYGRSFAVGAGCLVPRPETELLVDAAREWARGRGAPLAALDVGTGSGCIAISLALEVAGLSVTGVDVSPEALVWARENARALGAAVELCEADAARWLAELPQGSLDLLVSNPPYVERGDPALQADVRDHEPALALFAPDGDPDRFARLLLDAAPRVLRPGGLLLVELGHRQAPRVRALAEERGLRPVLRCDGAGIERVLAVELEAQSLRKNPPWPSVPAGSVLARRADDATPL